MTIALHFEQVIAVDLDQAWHSLHHDLCLLPAGLPHVRHIRELSREAGDAGPARVNYVWGIDHVVVPAVARPFLRDLLDEVRSDTHWHHPRRQVEFLFYTEGLKELFSCRGHFLLDQHDEGTRMQIIGELDVTPHELPGVPKLLSRSIMPAVERVVRDTISPSLEALPGALDQLIRSRQPGSL
jgi:hypothetical protein